MAEDKSKRLYKALWNSADILRSKMDADEYKDYLLGLVFYKYLSDNMLRYVLVLLEEETEDLQLAQNLYVQACEDTDIKKDLLDVFSYTIEPQLTFTAQVNAIHNGSFQSENLVQGFRGIEQYNEIFKNVFENIDLESKKLGVSPEKQNKTIADVMKELSVLNMAELAGNILGDTYESLIGHFASESGRKGAEFYTPQSVAKLMTQIVLKGKEKKKGFSVYDPTMGSGSLLLNAKRYSDEPGTISYFGQELNTSTYNLARMNMIIHGVSIANLHLNNADTLDQDWPTEEPTKFDAVLMNPPYSMRWSAEKEFLDDPRFSEYGVLAPKSKADFSFLLHGYYHLKESGTMAIVLPHGSLFRGAAEGKIRKILLENGAIDAVIGLPANIFFNTSIPTTVIVLKKDRPTKDVLFIDASQNFDKEKNHNTLKDEHIDTILETYSKREYKEKYAFVASFEDIVKNDYNLNISRYVDTFEEETVSLSIISTKIENIQQEIEKIDTELVSTLHALEGTKKKLSEDLQSYIKNH